MTAADSKKSEIQARRVALIVRLVNDWLRDGAKRRLEIKWPRLTLTFSCSKTCMVFMSRRDSGSSFCVSRAWPVGELDGPEFRSAVRLAAEDAYDEH